MLLYLVKFSRPDIRNSVRELSKAMDRATEDHYQSLIRVLKFVMMTPAKRAIDFAGAQGGKTLMLTVVSRANVARFGDGASEACNAMAAGIPELQGGGKKANWKAVLKALADGITEEDNTIPGFEDICAPNGQLGFKQIKAHISRALEVCGVRPLSR